MFKNRLGILTAMLAACFLLVAGRLWQLQVTRYAKYHALTTRDQTERMVPALRGPIVDRHGMTLAEDRPCYDLSVRLERVNLQHVTLEEVKAVRALAKNPQDRDAQFERITARLKAEPFVNSLAATVQRSDEEVATGMLKALDTVARNWASPRTPLRIVSAVDEKIWLGLRAAHEDIFRAESPYGGQPFPGLVCTVSTRRIYPHGNLASFVIGALGELSQDDEEALKTDGILLENAAMRSRMWTQIRNRLDDERAEKLEQILRIDPRELLDLNELYTVLSRLRPAERAAAATLGLAEPLRWSERPPRVRLTEPEALWLGVGLPVNVSKNMLPNRIIGEQGVERYRNDLLRGKSGMKIRNADNAAGGDDENLGFRRNSQPREGETVALTLSAAWQKAVESALKCQTRPGAAVVVDVKTGDVLALASYPDFDPNLFAPPRDGAERQEKLKALLDDPNKPLLNRAIAEQYPLGSVMKTLVAAVALERGAVSTTETFQCPGYIIEGGQKFRCDDSRAHGTVNIYKALRCSCNVTFHQIGARMGVETMAPYMKTILGRRSGIDLPGEVSGIYPDREWRLKTWPNNPAARVWSRGNDFQLSIGQGLMTSTVLQAALMMAAVANDGVVVTPRLWLEAPPAPQRSLGVSGANLAIVREGLDEVVNVNRPGERGTAYTPFHDHGELAVRVAGKTSTAEHKKDAEPHAWFAGYAPADNPQVAFAVLLEEGGHGGAAAAPVAYKFLRDVYGTKTAPVKNPGGPEEEKKVALNNLVEARP